MNRLIAPAVLVLSLALAGSAIAGPLKTSDDIAKFFTQQNLNGN